MSARLVFFLSVSAAFLFGLWSGYQISERKAARDWNLEQKSARKAEMDQLRGEIQALERQLEMAYSRTEGHPEGAVSTEEAIGHPAPGTNQPNAGPDGEMRTRAEQEKQLFTDQQGRELVAIILDVRPDGFMIRRTVDNAEMNLPLSLLSEKDQAFHHYLLEDKKAKEKARDEINWDELFK